MSENILVAFIGAGGLVLAAIITLIGKSKKRSSGSKKIRIKQKAKGNSNTQIGIVNNILNGKKGFFDEWRS